LGSFLAWSAPAVAVSLLGTPLSAQVQAAGPDTVPAVAAAAELPADEVRLAAGTPVSVMLDQDLSTRTSKTGDTFPVTVIQDVVASGIVVIPKGTHGEGEVIFAAGTGGFGRAGLLMIALRTLDLGNGRSLVVDGKFRQEGSDNSGATYATWIAVGVFSGFIKGKTGTIAKGRQLDGRTGEDFAIRRSEGMPPQAAGPLPAPGQTPPTGASAPGDAQH